MLVFLQVGQKKFYLSKAALAELEAAVATDDPNTSRAKGSAEQVLADARKELDALEKNTEKQAGFHEIKSYEPFGVSFLHDLEYAFHKEKVLKVLDSIESEVSKSVPKSLIKTSEALSPGDAVLLDHNNQVKGVYNYGSLPVLHVKNYGFPIVE